MSAFRDDAPPWSFFIPVTLAVIVGVLAADAIRYAVTTVMSGDAAGRSEEPQTRTPAVRADETPPSPILEERAVDAPPGTAEAPAAPAPVAAPQRAPSEQAAADAPQEVPGLDDGAPPVQATALDQLPGPISARRDEAEAACIHGTVAYRSGNGWEQALENDAPVRCEASSP